MSEPVANCPLCGKASSQLFDRREFRGHPITNRLCQGCGLVYQSPRMSASELDEFYTEEYRQLYQGSAGPNPKDLAVQSARARVLADFLARQVAQVARHLDIGCSAGLLLQQFQHSFHSQAYGVEPGEAYRAYARAQGLEVYPALENLPATPDSCFDLISLAHVLEHLPDPVVYLRRLRTAFLADNGLLLVEVPNLYAHDSFELAHLVSYSAHTLQQTLQQAGFSLLDRQAHGLPRSATIPLYLTAIARPASGQEHPEIIPERGVRLKRQWGMLRRHLQTRLNSRQAWLKAGLPPN